MKLLPLLSPVLCLLLLCPNMQAATQPSSTLIADNKVSALPIVVSRDASTSTRAVAEELASYLKQISEADFKIETGDGSRGIVLGTIQQFPVANLKEPLEIREQFDGVEAYAVRTEASRVLLLGATDLGVSHAAYRFLEALGCRWFFPAKEWEVIPTQSTLRVALNEASRPTFLSRRIWWSFGLPGEPGKPKEEWPAWQDWENWKRRNRHATSFTVYAAHSYGNIINANKKEFDAHPEYFALVNGKRVGWKMCLSNSMVRKFAIDYANNYFVKNPNADMISMEPTDGGGWCECDQCAKLGTPSDRAFGLANEAARALQKTHPGKMVGMLAYFQHSDPPSFKLEPNVHTQHATLYTSGKYSFAEQLELWPKLSDNLGIYDYPSTWVWGQDRLRQPSATGPGASMEYLKTNIPRYAATHNKSYDAESSNAWAQYGPGYYVLNKLLWNPQTDVDAVLKDFYEKAFGPAAPAVQRFYIRISPDNKQLFGRNLLAMAYRDIEEASTLAKDRPDVLARLDHLKQYLRFNHLYWLYINAPDKAAKKDAMLKLLTHAYRTRYSYMTHSAAMINEGSRGAAKEFEEPSWDYWNIKLPDKPWRVESFYTRDETKREFREGLEYFQPQRIVEQKYSDDLAPVLFGTNFNIKSTAAFADGGTARYTLFSKNGEDIAVDVSLPPGTKAVSYVLTDRDGKVLEENALQPDAAVRKVHPLQFKVGRAGLYDLEVLGINVLLAVQDGAPAVARLKREQPLGSYVFGGRGLWYFYVPKGTRELSLYHTGMTLELQSPDGQKTAATTNGDFQIVPVPPGADGKVWSLKGRIGHLIFFNAPNVVALSPDSLLLPRDLVEKDGLTTR